MSPWSSKTLGELTERTRPIQYGVLKPGPNLIGGVPLIRVTDISTNILNTTHLYRISSELDGEYRRSRLRGGEVLISIQGTIGKVAICPKSLAGANISRTIAVIDPDERVMPAFLRYCLIYKAETGGLWTVGTTRSSLNIGDLRETIVPVPSKEEQERIVNALEETEKLRQLRAQADRRTTDLIPALFHEMFGDPATNPMGWPKTNLGTAVELVRYGLGQLPEITNVGIPLLRATNVKRGRISPVGLIRVQKDKVPISRNAFLTGNDVLVVRSGAYTGDVAQVGKEWEGSVAGYDLVVSPGKTMTGEFLASYLLSKFIQEDYFAGLKLRAAQPHLNSQQLADAPLFLPPFPLQKSFSSRVAEIHAMEANQAESRRRLDDLFQALLHRAFQGEV